MNVSAAAGPVRVRQHALARPCHRVRGQAPAGGGAHREPREGPHAHTGTGDANDDHDDDDGDHDDDDDADDDDVE